jgi:hypothetical protein
MAGGYPHTHRNRTLVLNGAGAEQAKPDTAPAFVSSNGVNKQLMTKDTYEREQKHKLEYKEQQRDAKRQKRSADEQSRILRHFDSSSTGQDDREMLINGICFALSSDGVKLSRIPGTPRAHGDA